MFRVSYTERKQDNSTSTRVEVTGGKMEGCAHVEEVAGRTQENQKDYTYHVAESLLESDRSLD